MTDAYQPFDVLAVDALESVSRGSGRVLAPGIAASVVDEMRRLPAHPDVRPALEELRTAGFTIATLTNSPPPVLADQLRNAGIAELFDSALSVDPVARFKPHPDTYRSAAQRLAVPIETIRLVAAHDWDVTGAIRAGARAAFVARPGMSLGATSESPDIVASDLEAIAARIITGDLP